MNNNCIEDLQEFLNLPGISHDNNYVYFSLKKPMEKARSIEVEEESLLYVYDKYSLGGLKIYCQLAWIDKYQKQSGELSPFYYQTVNTLLNIPNASYLMKAMRKDGIIDYDIMGKDEHLKKLISVNSSLRL